MFTKKKLPTHYNSQIKIKNYFFNFYYI